MVYPEELTKRLMKMMNLKKDCYNYGITEEYLTKGLGVIASSAMQVGNEEMRTVYNALIKITEE